MTELEKDPEANFPKESHSPGPIHVLTIGVSRQEDGSGFPALAQCENNALAIRDCFLNYPQLKAEPTKVLSLTTKSSGVSRGAILSGVKNLALGAESHTRILLYFSGNGIRIRDQLYLVPEDAYDAGDPGCLVGWEQIVFFLTKSKAAESIIILDACWFEPENAPGQSEIRREFISDIMDRSNSIIVLVASADSDEPLRESPDTRLSLFTYHLKAALSGAREALEGKHLTIDSLFRFISEHSKRESPGGPATHNPLLENKSDKPVILGDFTPRVVDSSLALGMSPISSVQFVGSEAMRVKDVLTAIRKTYSAQYIASRVNETLGEHYEEDLGRAVARLKNHFDFPEDDVYAEGAGIRFPGGRYRLEYIPDTDKAGWLLEHVTFFSAWFSKPEKMAKILDTLDLRPTEMKLELATEITLKRLIPGMKANGWKLESQLDHKAEFSMGSYLLGLENDTITFRGFQTTELLGESETNQTKIAGQILNLLSNASA